MRKGFTLTSLRSASLSYGRQVELTPLRSAARSFEGSKERQTSAQAGRAGFTLVELIMVLAIVSIVAGTVFIGVDPARRLAAARNASRWADVTTLLEAIKKFEFDHDGILPSLDTDALTVQLVGKGGVNCRAARCPGQEIVEENCVLSSFSQELRPYLKNLPKDPKTGSDADTRYFVNRDEYGIISTGACDEEGEGKGGKGTPPEIEISR